MRRVNIMNFIIRNYEINLESFDSEYNDYDLYECDILKISRLWSRFIIFKWLL
jgi:hypothetical protein